METIGGIIAVVTILAGWLSIPSLYRMVWNVVPNAANPMLAIVRPAMLNERGKAARKRLILYSTISLSGLLLLFLGFASGILRSSAR